MKNRFLTLIIIIVFLVQIGILLFIDFNPFGPPKVVQRTPIPTLIFATPQSLAVHTQQISFGQGECQIAALDLIGAWVAKGKPENDSFEFTSSGNQTCIARFKSDVFPLFNQPNVWFAGAIACTSCHGQDIKKSAANMSLASYNDILAGSGREGSGEGNNILDTTNGWEKSKLYVQISTRQMPVGRPPDSPPKGPQIMVGTLKP
jgi:hypothetical protein